MRDGAHVTQPTVGADIYLVTFDEPELDFTVVEAEDVIEVHASDAERAAVTKIVGEAIAEVKESFAGIRDVT